MLDGDSLAAALTADREGGWIDNKHDALLDNGNRVADDTGLEGDIAHAGLLGFVGLGHHLDVAGGIVEPGRQPLGETLDNDGLGMHHGDVDRSVGRVGHGVFPTLDQSVDATLLGGSHLGLVAIGGDDDLGRAAVERRVQRSRQVDGVAVDRCRQP